MGKGKEDFYPCSATFREANKTFKCEASGRARNKLSVTADIDVWKVETDGEGEARMPPGQQDLACDWMVVSDEQEWKGIGIELKDSDYNHAAKQLTSTLQYAFCQYHIIPMGGFIVMSGRHPRNALSSKQNSMVKFAQKFPGAHLKEKRAGGQIHLNSDFKI